MITHENIEIIHRFFQVDKTSFEEMLSALLQKYNAVYTPVRLSLIHI